MLLVVLIAAAAMSGATAVPEFLINCGLPNSNPVTSDGHRVWRSDENQSFSPSNINTVSSATVTTSNDGGILSPPFQHARVFHSPFTYSFKVSPGPKFLRLYFASNSTIGNTNSSSQFFLSLQANSITLLHNFSSYLNSGYLSKYTSGGSFIEFYLTQLETPPPHTLNLTFSSGDGVNYGFVNGIEIISLPDGIYLNNSDANGIPQSYIDVNSPSIDYIMPSATSFQTMYRLNVGGSDVQPVNDSGDLGRTWLKDNDYIFGNFYGLTTFPPAAQGMGGIRYTKESPVVAPKQVYSTERFIGGIPPVKPVGKNLSWLFDVDQGFDHLVRLHFCEMQRNVNASDMRVFDVYINKLLAQKSVDVFAISGGQGSPIHRDYIVHTYGTTSRSGALVDASNGTKIPLLLMLTPNLETATLDVLLNGLEILKLNQSNGNLAVPNPSLPVPPPGKNPGAGGNGPKRNSFAIIGGVLGAAMLVSFISVICLFLYKRRRAKKKPTFINKEVKDKNGNWLPVSIVSGSSTSNLGSSLPSDLCRRFSFVQIRVATSDFDDASIIGIGGFGKVYKGIIDNDGGATTVAIKRLNPSSKQGAHEFLTEIEMLSRLRHLHLVSLIGYCEDQGEMILVYEYMPRGTLRDHLMYKNTSGDINTTNATPLSWNQRLMICVGSARGLHYLHSGTKELIIHRDVKSTNILLDDKWTAKVSDFGLSKVGPASETGIGHVSTAVKGSIGYLDPEYYKRQQLTEKSDVYSFGVVLFEVLCARPAANPSLPKEQVNLALWARSCYMTGTLHRIVDPNLTGQIAPECLSKFGEIAELCVRDKGSERPSMGDIVWALEFAMQLQETAEKNNINGAPFERFTGPTSDIIEGDGVDTDNDMFGTIVDSISQSSDTRATRPLLGNGTTTTTTTESSDNRDMRSGLVFSEILNPQAR